jgi:hypothetical protein
MFDSGEKRELIGGSWYAPIRTHERTDYTNVEVIGYRCLRPMPTVNGQTRWELECTTCGIRKPVPSASIREALEAGGPIRRFNPCQHPAIPLRASAVRDEFGMAPETLRAMICVLAHERVHGVGCMRLDMKGVMGAEPETASLIKKGWLTSEGLPSRLSSTAKARRALGFGST